MTGQQLRYTLEPSNFGIPRNDGGWVYAVRTGGFVKVGKTTDPRRRLLREAQTWCPSGLDEIIAKPFWNITKLEYSLHTCLAEHWHRGEWHKFTDSYWLDFFLDGLRQFRDPEEGRDANSIDFGYWMSGSGYAEVIGMQCEHKMSLPEWRRHRGDPWRCTRDALREKMNRTIGPPIEPLPEDEWSPLMKAAAALAWRDEDNIDKA
jgi:hypothetical protein